MWAKMRSALGRSGSASSKACRTGVRGANREIGNWAAPRWQHTKEYPVSEKEEKRNSKIPPSADTFAARDHTWEQKEERGRMGGKGTMAYPQCGPAIVRYISSRPPNAHHDRHVWPAVAVLESCIVTMRTEGSVGSRELATPPAVCGISTSTKLGLSWPMVIVVAERIKCSRCEEVDGGQLKWAIDKSKRNVKAMRTEAHDGKSRVWIKARPTDAVPTRTCDSTDIFNGHFHLRYRNLTPSVGLLCWSKYGAKAETLKVQVFS
jgi:hypothetical protein